VPKLGLKQVVGQHGVEHRSLYLDVIPFEYGKVEFDILTDLLNFFILEYLAEKLNDLQGIVIMLR
jgi:hypothetical protein